MLIWKKLLHLLLNRYSQNATTAKQASSSTQKPSLHHTLDEFRDCMDLTYRNFPALDIHVVYLAYLVGNDELQRDIIVPFEHAHDEQAVQAILAHAQYVRITTNKPCIKGILEGHGAIFFQSDTYLVNLSQPIGRKVEQTEMETVISGPHDGLVESLELNIGLLRSRIKSSHLKTLRLSVGEISKTDVVVMYLADIVDMELVYMLIKRIRDIEVDGVLETNVLVQLIEENPNSVFPQYMTTERPDTVASKLLGGRIVGLVDGSPSAFSAPTSFFEFFSSPDDYYQRWLIGTSLRILRFIGFTITIGFTAFYVSVTTFHYEMIPHTMLLNLTLSRSKVPFPPLVEALLMETTIELLREAGARLPTKIGQTIGIVGGIVIGQAAVQAGFTSNILIIAVASSAIASFVIPSYIMSASIRLVRFGFIVLAGMWGNMGLVVGIGLMIIHLSGLTNLGTSYLTPVAPMNFKDWGDTFIRAPHWMIKKRPSQPRTVNVDKNKMRR
jgi:spore germination protein